VIRVEVTSEADVTRMVAAFSILEVLDGCDYEIWLTAGGAGGGGAMRRSWRHGGVRGSASPDPRRRRGEVPGYAPCTEDTVCDDGHPSNHAHEITGAEARANRADEMYPRDPDPPPE
jgi:hypothetical protein